MTVDPTAASAPSLIERAKNILLQPQSEWDRIAGESADVSKLYTRYVLPLAGLAAIASFVGVSVFGYSAFGVTVRVPMAAGAVGAVVQLVMGLVGVYVLALITNALAPNFGSRQDVGQAHKLAVYGSTASLLAGVFAIFPPLAMLAILGLYSLVLLYIGLPRLMKTPEDKRVGYLVTVIIVAIVIGIVMGVVSGAARGAMGGLGGPGGYNFGQTAPSQHSPAEGQVTLPGGGTVDLSELEKMGQAMQQGGGAAIDPMRLQEQLPQTLPGGFALASASSASAMGTAQAEGVYQNGDAGLTVTVVHMGAMGGIAAMAGAMNVQENRQDADGYARTQTIDGRMFTEEMSNSGGSVKYGVVGHGVAVTVEGTGGVTMDQARAAVETIGVQRLERQFAR